MRVRCIGGMIFLILLCFFAAPRLSVSAHQGKQDPNKACKTSPQPHAIQVQSGRSGVLLPIPTTSISVDGCTLSMLRAQGDLGQVAIASDGSVPPGVLAMLRKLVALHVNTLWDKAMHCPHPEYGVFFNVITPTSLDLLTSPLNELWEWYAPTIQCSGAQ